MAENLATKMEDSIFKETFSYLRVSTYLTAAVPISFFQTLRIIERNENALKEASSRTSTFEIE